MRILAIGDIHGCRTALETLADYVGFQPDDMVVTLGDYVDRGPDSKGVIECLLEWQQRYRLIALRGNHEIMMVEARQSRSMLTSWLGVGGAETIDSYGTSFDDVPDAHWTFMESTRPYYETETHFFVHANADPNLPLAEQTEDDLYWRPFFRPKAHASGKVMICGHTAQRKGKPKSVGHAICIDTHAYANRWLTCLDVSTGIYFQANQLGDTQSDVL